MGYSIPAAIGAKKADQARQVVAVCGDGGFQMSMCELAVIKQEKLSVKVVVLKNNYLGMVREFQHFNLNDNYEMVDLPDYPELSFLAKAYDMKYVKLDKKENMDSAIREFLKNDEAVLMEVVIDPMDTVRYASH